MDLPELKRRLNLRVASRKVDSYTPIRGIDRSVVALIKNDAFVNVVVLVTM